MIILLSRYLSIFSNAADSASLVAIQGYTSLLLVALAILWFYALILCWQRWQRWHREVKT